MFDTSWVVQLMKFLIHFVYSLVMVARFGSRALGLVDTNQANK